jgi:hypothetical protein
MFEEETCGNEGVFVARGDVGDTSKAVHDGVFLRLAAVDEAALACACG